MKKRIYLFLIIISSGLMLGSCSKDDKSINLFTIEDDMKLGQELKTEIESNPQLYPILNPSQYHLAYEHIYRMRDAILASGQVAHANTFTWEVKIIKNDTVLNAFCAPGGYIFFYTGLIKFLDDESQCSGVMGHEMAHAARRHSTDQLTKAYGIQILLAIILGNNPTQMAEIVAGLAAGVATLAFSRDAEYESDEYSVKYLYQTEYDARGVGGFFRKIDGSPQPPEFLSTHPHPDNRYEKIDKIWQDLGGKTGGTFPDRYQAFKNSLP